MDESQSASEKLSNGINNLLDKLTFKRKELYLDIYSKLITPCLIACSVIFVINIVLFLSLAIKLKRFEPLLIAVVVSFILPLLFFSWKNMVDFVVANRIFAISLFLPKVFCSVVGSLLLAIAILVLIASLVASVYMGSFLIMFASLVASLLLYQWFSVLIRPELLGFSFKEKDYPVLIFPDWAIFKAFMLYCITLEISFLGLILTPFLLFYDLFQTWTLSASHLISRFYSTVLLHQAVWALLLAFPVIGYLCLQAWVFTIEVFKGLWLKCFVKPNNKEEKNEE